MKLLHGGDIYSYKEKKDAGLLVDFSANISPLGMPEKVRQAILDELEDALHYPDPCYRRLRAAIAEKISGDYGILQAADGIICGNGAADVIYRLVLALRPRTALLCAPTFAEYEEALRLCKAKLKIYALPPDTLTVEDEILDALTPEVDMMFLCNPNNPTGLLISQTLMRRIIEKTRSTGIFLVVDECFLDFSGEEKKRSVLPELSQNKHILVLKSFTKMYAIPGVRLGYGVCRDMELVEAMGHAGQAWPVSTLAESAGIAALSCDEYKAAVCDYVENERRYLFEQLESMGIRYWRSCANYILMRIPKEYHAFEQLEERGLIIRRCANYRNLDDSFYRIAVNRHEDNMRLVNELQKIMNTL